MSERVFDRGELFRATLLARQLADFVRPGPNREREAAEAIDLLCEFAMARADAEHAKETS